MPDLSILIPARNEMFLARTIQDVLENATGDTEIIAVMDGALADPPVAQHPHVHIIYHPQSIGQRAATNEAAKLSTAKYLMKCDAHCAFDKGFDVKLMADMHDDWTMVPTMRNLHAFDWVCQKCRSRRYQGPTPTSCQNCDNTTDFVRDVVWIAKTNPQSKSYCFDSTPHFQYFREFNRRPEGRGDLTETMSLQGSCFLITREKYWELGVCDESFGSWGTQGIEVAIKTWLSGGRVIVNQKTWYAHMFRTQGGDFGFPYPLPGKQVERAKIHARELFFENKWEKQVHPLSWLVEKFWPVPGWTQQDLDKLKEKEKLSGGFGASLGQPFVPSQNTLSTPITRIGNALADKTGTVLASYGRQEMTANTVGLSGVDGGDGIATSGILCIENQSQMEGIATGGIVANDMVKYGDMPALSSCAGSRQGGNKPCPHESVGQFNVSPIPNMPISKSIPRAEPYPTSSIVIHSNSGEEAVKELGIETTNNQTVFSYHASIIPPRLSYGKNITIISALPYLSRCALYYTDNRLDPLIMRACQSQLTSSLNGHDIVSVSLKPVGLGRNITLDMERGYLTMFRQILAGLEANRAEIVFFAEHDVLYPPEYFDFMPPDRAKVYYNLNVWLVRSSDGHALYYDAKRTSQLCAYRDILLEHYRKRVERVEKEGFSRKMGFEPGTHHRNERVDDLQSDVWVSKYPAVDIKHGRNLTPARWSPDQFRDKRNCRNWQEADSIPYWGITAGRFEEFLAQLSHM